MKHLGDITQIDGHAVPAVDVVVGGSPCQDLSVAGKRAGLAGERSGLYMEQIRIIKEMREHARANGCIRGVSPRYMVWENVPGALSSNGCEDFRAVLEEAARIVEPECVIPRPPNGKWTNAGCIMGDGWSIAWRIHDARFWGVPQRRRRIALVADFGGGSAPEILFERKSVSRDIEPSEPKRKETSSDASRSLGADDRLGADQYNAVILGDTVSTIGVNCGMSTGRQCVLEPQEVVCFEPGIASREGGHIYEGVSGTLRANAGDNQMATAYTLKIMSGRECGVNVPMVMQQCFSKSKRAQSATDNETWLESETANTLNAFDVGDVRTTEAAVYCLQGNGIDRADTAGCNGRGWRDDDASYTLNTVERPAVYDDRGNSDGETCPTITGDHENRITDYTAVCISGEDVADTLDASYYKGCGERGFKERTVIATYGVDCRVDCRNGAETPELNGTLQAKSSGGTSCNLQNVVRQNRTVRRLTPLECERLQGYPDGWTDIGEWVDSKGKRHQTTDSNRYKALGNSIALPYWRYLLKRISAQYEYIPTMASLFDGIGGFPYLWESINGKGTCVWASEIDEFPMAVTKRRIGE